MDGVSAKATAEALTSALAAHREAVDSLEALAPRIACAADSIARSFAGGGQLLVCGNGGSAADAQHVVAEFVGRFLKERTAFPALALSTNSSAVTAIGNDYGFDEIFARQVRAHGRAGDVLLAISTSGTSPNVLAAIDAAHSSGMAVIGLAGGDGGTMAGRCDCCITVPVTSTPRVQEAHILVAHVICGLVEDALS